MNEQIRNSETALVHVTPAFQSNAPQDICQNPTPSKRKQTSIRFNGEMFTKVYSPAIVPDKRNKQPAYLSKTKQLNTNDSNASRSTLGHMKSTISTANLHYNIPPLSPA